MSGRLERADEVMVGCHNIVNDRVGSRGYACDPGAGLRLRVGMFFSRAL